MGKSAELRECTRADKALRVDVSDDAVAGGVSVPSGDEMSANKSPRDLYMTLYQDSKRKRDIGNECDQDLTDCLVHSTSAVLLDSTVEDDSMALSIGEGHLARTCLGRERAPEIYLIWRNYVGIGSGRRMQHHSPRRWSNGI
jgi:hypothetical protein